MFRPSVWAIIRCDLQIKLYNVHGGGARSRLLGGVFLMQCISRFGINLPYTTVARGVSCFCLYSKLYSLG